MTKVRHSATGAIYCSLAVSRACAPRPPLDERQALSNSLSVHAVLACSRRIRSAVVGLVIVALSLTHITIAGVTIYLHRHQAHRALDLHPIPSPFLPFLAVADHRHGHQGMGGDPPQAPRQVRDRRGSAQPADLRHQRCCWGGVELYAKEAHNQETLDKYGHGTPDDWMERNVYTRAPLTGVTLDAASSTSLLFGSCRASSIWAVQMRGFRSGPPASSTASATTGATATSDCEDASTNIVPWGILIGGEELHNNHHALRLVGQAVEQVVRVRHRLAVHPDAGDRSGSRR